MEIIIKSLSIHQMSQKISFFFKEAILKKKLVLFCFCIVFFILQIHSGSAFACMGAVDFELFKMSLVMAFTVTAISILIFSFVSWFIKIIFFKAQSQLTVIFLVAFLFSIELGVFGTFMVPKFEEVVRDFGADVSREANFVFAYGNYLWSPAFLVLVLWFFLKNSFSKDRYFAAVLFVDAVMLVFSLSAIYAVNSSCG